MNEERPCVVFVCVKNAGKSQMAAALARRDAGEALEIHSAGVRPGSELNDLSRRSLEEAGASVAGEYPKPLDAALLRRADRVVVLGREAVVEPVEGMRGTIVTWDTDEPSTRGIEGIERMRLVRDDIARRVDALVSELVPRD
ncbi:low molecular weight phosphatase family protein [Tersicoccus sp. Bi-70]|uniref:arsenate-mycothiol transferase ArsC n=1 Tax=Tersicoccus sp. Bi-70 TaxID=1897634 RepID=UPI000977E496|nr:low molecular weight phosphatase family protein [Tersicoccus sp. Bi-70]